ncbi:MAG: hypothetical protein E7450_08700, partial [Ruminococcaceae bacterium]|nr:hypothetical protein [Oscillospiraceae bacterium]
MSVFSCCFLLFLCAYAFSIKNACHYGISVVYFDCSFDTISVQIESYNDRFCKEGVFVFWFLRANFVCSTTDVADICFQTMFSVDFMRHTAPTLAPVHSHLNYELFFVNQGQCTFRCGDRDYTCNPSDILVINAGTLHNRLQISPDALLYSLQFSFSPNSKQTS